jgi:hypothetical protein
MPQKLKKFKPTKTKIYKMSQGFQNSLKALSVQFNGNIAIYVNNEIVGDKKIAYLVFTPITTNEGVTVPDLVNTVSLELPCPPYCTRGTGGDIEVMVETEGTGGTP